MKKRILFAGIFACITALFLMTGCPHHSSSGGWYLPNNTNPGGGNAGQITNADVKIVKSEGLLNSAYVIFEQIPNTEYTVLIDDKGLDEQLIRYYDTYTYYEASESNGQTSWTKNTLSNVVRADALGLKAESHTIKVAVKGSTRYSTATMNVTDHDRSGFAFTGSTTPGAYNKDGTLKDNAIVVYADNSNFNTVTLTVKKNSKGETITFTGVQKMVDTSGYWQYAQYNGNGPLCIRIIGTVDLTGFPSSNWGSSAEGLQVKGNQKVDTVATIEGVGHDATLHGFGILARNSRYLEIQNLALMNFNDDGISLDTDNLYTWIHNLDIFYGKKGSASDQKKGDGSLDVKGDSKWQTYSYNHFWDSGKMSLCGMKDETGPNYITYHHNWFDHSDSRHPRIRTMSVHVYNNYYDGNSKYGAGATTGADAFVEGNYFRNVKFPMLSSMQGNDVYAGSSKYDPGNYGTFSGESGGSIKSWNNKIVDTNKNTSYWPHKNSKTAPLITKGATGSLPSGVDTAVHFDAWEASSRNEKVPASVKAFDGEDTYSNFDTTENLGLSIAPTDPDAAKKNVIAYAGRHTPDFAWKFDNASEDTDSDVNTTLQNALVGYKSGLKKAQSTGGTGTGGGSGTTTPGGDSGDTGGGDSGNTGGNTGGGNPPSPPPAGAVASLTFDNASSLNPVSAGIVFTVAKGSSAAGGKDFFTSTGKVKILKMEKETTIAFTTPSATTDSYTMTINYVTTSAVTLGLAPTDGTKETISLPIGGSLGTSSSDMGSVGSVTTTLKGGTAYTIGDRSSEHYIHSIVITE